MKYPDVKSKKSIFKWLTVLGVSAGGIWWWHVKSQTTDQTFTISKDWSGSLKSLPSSDPVYQWFYLQCHEPLFAKTLSGTLSLKSGKSFERQGSTSWMVTLHEQDRWSDDGAPVTAMDYQRGWQTRSTNHLGLEFIENIQAKNEREVLITLKQSTPEQSYAQALTSIWLSPVKQSAQVMSDPSQVDIDLSGPCNGPFVPQEVTDDEWRFSRNTRWSRYQKQLIQELIVKKATSFARRSTSQGKEDLAAILGREFAAGRISYLSSAGRGVGDSRLLVEPRSYYLLINPKGSLGREFFRFFHLAINRGEHVAAATPENPWRPMYRLMPLSFMSNDGRQFVEKMPAVNRESIVEARKLLKVPDTVSSMDIKFPIARDLILIVPDDQRIEPIAKVYASRLRANFNATIKILPVAEGDEPTSWDLMIVGVDLDGGLRGWLKNLGQVIGRFVPQEVSVKQRFNKGYLDDSEPSVEQMLVWEDGPDEFGPVMGLGQFAKNYLVDRTVVNVVVRGDPSVDPDVSLASRIKPIAAP